VMETLWEASREGQDPVLVDASACALSLVQAAARLASGGRTLRILDFPAFWAREVMPVLPPPAKRPGLAVLHPTCSLTRAGGMADLLAVARAHAEEVRVPLSTGCCGFAGDRGLLVPELLASATLAEVSELAEIDPTGAAGLYSTNRTCELGLTHATGRPWRSLVRLVHEAWFRA
jgi:D-lactate dehydrogenase